MYRVESKRGELQSSKVRDKGLQGVSSTSGLIKICYNEPTKWSQTLLKKIFQTPSSVANMDFPFVITFQLPHCSAIEF